MTRWRFFVGLLLCFCVFATGLLSSQTAGWSLRAAPNLSLPVLSGDFGANTDFAPAVGASLGASYALAASLPLELRLSMGYARSGFPSVDGISVPGSIDEISALGGLKASWPLSPVFSLGSLAEGGLGYGFVSTGVKAPIAMARLGVSADLRLDPSWTATIEASFVEKFGLYGGIGLDAGVAYRLPERAPAAPSAQKLRLLEFSSLYLRDLFPIFRSYYDTNAVGTVKLHNAGKSAATGVRLSFLMKQYMDAPKECSLVPRIEAGETIELPLYALFNDSILAVTEATKAAAEITVEYDGGGELSRSATVLVLDRNALTWDDDRKAAAFVSSKDPWVLDLSGNMAAACKDARNPEVPKNIQTGLAIHEGLRAYGLGYVLSPNRPFAQAVVDKSAVDSLKFPRQTLGHKAGDCADLSVLYASFFEAAGIETAFVTVPGHIFMAFDSGLRPEEARARAMDERELIIKGDKVWIPVETTMREAGFLEVWRKAAGQWRDSSAKGEAAVFPIHEAWITYPPVGLPADGSTVAAPATSKVATAFTAELAKVASLEMNARIALLGPVSAQASQNSPSVKQLNDRGILYAKYAYFADAERDFKAAAKAGSAAASINLGNIAMLKKDPAAAYDLYLKADKLNPENVNLLINLAKAASALGKNDAASAVLDRVKALDPKTADRYASLAAIPNAAQTRAAETEEAVLWF